MVSSSEPSSEGLALNLCLLDGLASGSIEQLRRSSALQRVRTLVADGCITPALDIVQTKLPEVAQDPRLMFRLRKQTFIEILRKGASGDSSAHSLAEAVACARAQLAPMALDAYPEAYTEFKQVLQLLLYAGNMQCSPQSPACPMDCQVVLSEASRRELAEVVFQTAREATGYQEPKLVQMLMYLLRLHSMHPHLLPSYRRQQQQQQQGASEAGKALKPAHRNEANGMGGAADAAFGAAPDPAGRPPDSISLGGSSRDGGSSHGGSSKGGGSSPGRGVRRGREPDAGGASALLSSSSSSSLRELCEQLLLPGCDAAPLRDEAHGAVSFRETDIQVLMSCAGSSRRGAIAALRHHRNRLWPAFQSELQRLRINRPLLLDLVLEYCQDRGLACAPAACSNGCHSHSSEQGDMDADMGSDGEGNLQGDMDVQRGAGTDGGPQGSLHAPDHQDVEECLTGPRGLPRLTVRRSASRSPPAKMHCCRHPPMHAPAGGGAAAAAADRLAAAANGVPHEGTAAGSGPALLDKLRHVAEVDGLEAFHAAVAEAAPGFWEQHPSPAMELWAAAFSARLGAGDVQGALGVARAHMAPLAAQHTQLQPKLKAAMALLIPAPLGSSSSLPLQAGPAGGAPASAAAADKAPSATATSNAAEAEAAPPVVSKVVDGIMSLLASTQLGGGHHTRLVKLLQELLALHKAWLRAERLSDPFQSELGITALRAGHASMAQGTSSNGAALNGGAGNTAARARDAGGMGTGGPRGGDGAGPGQLQAAHRQGSQDGAAQPQQQPQPTYRAGPAWGEAGGVGDPYGIMHHGPPSPRYQPHMGDGMSSDEEGEGEDGGWGPPGGAGGRGGGEQDVLRLMEILAVPRPQAVALLSDYGDVEAAVNSTFG